MECPMDGAELVMTERQGVEIDYCPTCRGVWLDRGELDKIIDRSARLSDPAGQGVGYGDLRPGELRREPREVPQHRKRKESWLGELFDF